MRIQGGAMMILGPRPAACNYCCPCDMNRLPVRIACLFTAVQTSVSAAAVDFNRDIRPILSNHCFQCHGPDDAARESDLRLDRPAGALADLGGYAAVVPGDPENSQLVSRITANDPDSRMPTCPNSTGRCPGDRSNY